MSDTEPQAISLESKQEQLTQEYDKFLTKTEDLENNPDVTVDEVATTNGEKVKRYNLHGANFAFLSHTIGLNINNDNLTTSQNINEKISTWNGVKKGEANNQISCSLITHDHIAHPFSRNRVLTILGFNHLEGNDLLATAGRDAGAVVKGVDISMDEFHMDSPKGILETQGYGFEYNEVVIRRYSSDGQSVRQPDFIITFDGQISDQIQQAIDYFHIPVVNFQTNKYVEQINQQISTTLDQIDPDTPLDEQKKIFSQIPLLVVNRNNWRMFSFDRDTPESNSETNKRLSKTESSIAEQQLAQDQEAINLATEKLKAGINYQSLQEFKDALNQFITNLKPSEKTNFLFNADHNLMIKWSQESLQTILQAITSTAPDIVKYYQEQLTRLSQQIDKPTTDQLRQELKDFEQSSTIIKIDQQLMFYESLNRGFDITRDAPQYIDVLKQIYSAQEQLKTQIYSEIKQSEQGDQQNQINTQDITLEMASSNFSKMAELLQSNQNNYDFCNQILTKIKEYLSNGPKETTKVITVFRDHQDLFKKHSEVFYQAFGDGYDNEIYRLLADPAKSPTVPKRITLLDTTITDSFNRESKITSFIDSNGQNHLFEIYPEIGHTKSLETPNNKPTQDVIDKLNKKWLWRLRHRLPQFDTSNTYQLNSDSPEQLLVTAETDFYLINGKSVKKIKMSEFNIGPINQHEKRQAY